MRKFKRAPLAVPIALLAVALCVLAAELVSYCIYGRTAHRDASTNSQCARMSVS